MAKLMIRFVTGSGVTKIMNVKETEAYKENNPTLAPKVLGVTIEGGVRMIYLKGAEVGAAHRKGYAGHVRIKNTRSGRTSDPTGNQAVGNVEPKIKGKKASSKSEQVRVSVRSGMSLYEALISVY